MGLNQNLNRNMKEAGISLSCAVTAINACMSTFLGRYSYISVNGIGVRYSASTETAIQGLAAFIPDGSFKYSNEHSRFNNKVISKNTVV